MTLDSVEESQCPLGSWARGSWGGGCQGSDAGHRREAGRRDQGQRPVTWEEPVQGGVSHLSHLPRWMDRQAGRQTHRQTCVRTHMHSDTHTHVCTHTYTVAQCSTQGGRLAQAGTVHSRLFPMNHWPNGQAAGC